jgi:hypothetical protein
MPLPPPGDAVIAWFLASVLVRVSEISLKRIEKGSFAQGRFRISFLKGRGIAIRVRRDSPAEPP